MITDMKQNINGLQKAKTLDFQVQYKEGKIIYSYECSAKAVFGLGERYCSVNHKGRILVNKVLEQFTRQNENTYFPLPFYHASDGHGVYVNTLCEVTFSFEENRNKIEIAEDASHTIYFFYGSTEDIIKSFVKETGKALLPPKWAFGVWASANRWNCQRHVEEQLKIMEQKKYPVSVLVIEAWSDEATFYIFNGAQYAPKSGEAGLTLSDFTFKDPWHDPVGMIRKIHEKGIKLILWQIPALKELEEGRTCLQHHMDQKYAKEQDLVVKNETGEPYLIPKQWFIGAMIPDFSNTETIKWWHEKRKYLLDEMQVDGFKTDGGEFIHDTEVMFHCGFDGKQGRNAYPALYEAAYQEWLGENRVLFSRAGYLGSQKTPMHWAGDQVSEFSELKSVMRAGLSLSLSGVPFWSFDIAGFAGAMPDKELYLRSTAFAAFVPAMQWHSEPADGQFAEIMKGSGGLNDRSPWNMEQVCNDSEVMEISGFFANLHMNFLPYFYSEAMKAVQNNLPFMKHLALEYGEDEHAILCDDEYMIGDLLVAPIVEPFAEGRKVYLPKGVWYDFWSGEKIEGGCKMEARASLASIPLYLRENGAVILHLDNTWKTGGFVGNELKAYENLCLIYAGEKAKYHFMDDLGNHFIWNKERKVKVKHCKEFRVREVSYNIRYNINIPK